MNMKTLDEVIEELQYWDTCHEYPECFYDDEVTRDALHYLKEYQRYQNTPSRNGYMALVDYFEESQKNEPLTWDELKKMKGKPVWIEDHNDDDEPYNRWYIVERFIKEQDDEYALLNDLYFSRKYFNDKTDGWQAYRKERE